MLPDQLADAVRDADKDDRRRDDTVRERLDRVGKEHTPILVPEAVELVDEDRDGALPAGVLQRSLYGMWRDRSRAQQPREWLRLLVDSFAEADRLPRGRDTDLAERLLPHAREVIACVAGRPRAQDVRGPKQLGSDHP